MKRILFSERARADIRRLDRDTEISILIALDRLASTGQGDVKRLKGETGDLRLRVGDYRVRFTEEADAFEVSRVLHRREAYR